MDTPNSPPRSALLTVIFVAGLMAAATGCTNAVEGSTTGLMEGASAVTCDDADEDGFGPGCVAGEDCDDEDASVTSACYRCAEPGPGCPCEVESSRLFCEQVVSYVGTQKSCGPGYATCRNGVWDECILNYTATPTSAAIH